MPACFSVNWVLNGSNVDATFSFTPPSELAVCVLCMCYQYSQSCDFDWYLVFFCKQLFLSILYGFMVLVHGNMRFYNFRKDRPNFSCILRDSFFFITQHHITRRKSIDGLYQVGGGGGGLWWCWEDLVNIKGKDIIIIQGVELTILYDIQVQCIKKK